MCFAFTSTESQLTARSYPNHDITPPAMTLLVERGSEKRTGVKSKKIIRPKLERPPPPPGAMAGPSNASAAADRLAAVQNPAGRTAIGRAAAAAAGVRVSGPRPPPGATQQGRPAPPAAARSAMTRPKRAVVRARRRPSPRQRMRRRCWPTHVSHSRLGRARSSHCGWAELSASVRRPPPHAVEVRFVQGLSMRARGSRRV